MDNNIQLLINKKLISLHIPLVHRTRAVGIKKSACGLSYPALKHRTRIDQQPLSELTFITIKSPESFEGQEDVVIQAALYPDRRATLLRLDLSDELTPSQLNNHLSTFFPSEHRQLDIACQERLSGETFDENYLQKVQTSSHPPKFTYLIYTANRAEIKKQDVLRVSAPQQLTDSAGQTYTRVKGIGSGANGSVSIYEDASGRRVAIKVPKSDLELSQLGQDVHRYSLQNIVDRPDGSEFNNQCEALRNEAKLIGVDPNQTASHLVLPQFQGTFTASIPGCRQTAQIPFVGQVLMEESRPLMEVAREDISIAQVRQIFSDCVQMLRQMSALGLGHHDMTWENILMGATQSVAIDWGSSQKGLPTVERGTEEPYRYVAIDWGSSQKGLPTVERGTEEPYRYTLVNRCPEPPKQEAAEEEFEGGTIRMPAKEAGAYSARRHDLSAMGKVMLNVILKFDFMKQTTWSDKFSRIIQKLSQSETAPETIRSQNHARLYTNGADLAHAFDRETLKSYIL